MVNFRWREDCVYGCGLVIYRRANGILKPWTLASRRTYCIDQVAVWRFCGGSEWTQRIENAATTTKIFALRAAGMVWYQYFVGVSSKNKWSKLKILFFDRKHRFIRLAKVASLWYSLKSYFSTRWFGWIWSKCVGWIGKCHVGVSDKRFSHGGIAAGLVLRSYPCSRCLGYVSWPTYSMDRYYGSTLLG